MAGENLGRERGEKGEGLNGRNLEANDKKERKSASESQTCSYGRCEKHRPK